MSDSEDFSNMDYGVASSPYTAGVGSNIEDHIDDPVDIVQPSVENDVPSYESANQDHFDFKPLIKELKEACKELGIQCDDEMINVMKSSSSLYEIGNDSMRWFVMGIAYANNKRIIPQFKDIINEMKSEIKTLQQTNSHLKTSSMDITQKMVSVKNDILDGFDTLRANVIDKVVEMTLKANEGLNVKKETGAEHVSVKLDLKEPSATKISKSVLPVEVKSVPSTSKIPDPRRKKKMARMKLVGGNMKLIDSLSDDEINVFFPDIWMSTMEYGEKSDVQLVSDKLMLALYELSLLKL